jgi:hypothetical protein
MYRSENPIIYYKILIYILAKEKKTLNIKLNDQIIKTI